VGGQVLRHSTTETTLFIWYLEAGRASNAGRAVMAAQIDCSDKQRVEQSDHCHEINNFRASIGKNRQLLFRQTPRYCVSESLPHLWTCDSHQKKFLVKLFPKSFIERRPSEKRTASTTFTASDCASVTSKALPGRYFRTNVQYIG
jgi:hypothetical protein